jgi:hypothetical protein
MDQCREPLRVGIVGNQALGAFRGQDMAKLSYYIEIRNDYLGKYKRITGRSRREVEFKTNEQLLRWAQEEQRARERAAIADEKERAKQATEDALARIEEYRGILKATLPVDDRIRWQDLLDRNPYPKPPPRLSNVIASVGVPKKRPLIEKLNPSLTARRVEAEQAAHTEYERLMRTHAARAREYKNEQAARNAEVEGSNEPTKPGMPKRSRGTCLSFCRTLHTRKGSLASLVSNTRWAKGRSWPT